MPVTGAVLRLPLAAIADGPMSHGLAEITKALQMQRVEPRAPVLVTNSQKRIDMAGLCQSFSIHNNKKVKASLQGNFFGVFSQLLVDFRFYYE